MNKRWDFLSSQTLLLSSVLVFAASFGGCSPSENADVVQIGDDGYPVDQIEDVAENAFVSSEAVAVEKLFGSLAVDSVLKIGGIYGAGCADRVGRWAIALNGYTFVGGEKQLTVLKGDVGCILSVDEVKAGPTYAPELYLPDAPIPLTAAYAEIGSPLRIDGAGLPAVYVNFRVLPNLSFETDFVVEMVYSSDINNTDLSIITGYAVTEGLATASGIAPPNASLVPGGIHVVVDSENIVKSAYGTAMLNQGTIVAEWYVVHAGSLGPLFTYGEVDSAFNLPGNTRVALLGASREIPATEFMLEGIDLTLPQVRSVIVANTENGINSYQIFTVTIQRPLGPMPINLETAGNYAVLAATAASIGAAGGIDGNVGLYFAPSAALTGFVLALDPSGLFSTSLLVNGNIFAMDHVAPTPDQLGVAATDMQAAYADGSGRLNPDGLNLGLGELGGLVLSPGLYKWTSAATITTDLTLDGGAGDVWILQIGGALSMTAAMTVHLEGGALASNVYWVVLGAVALGADAQFPGTVIAQGAISTGAGTMVDGVLLGATTVAIGADSFVTQP